MSEKERAEITEMTETASMLAKHDPQSLKIAKAILEALRARCETEKEMKDLEKAG